jgi:hypothetical protein
VHTILPRYVGDQITSGAPEGHGVITIPGCWYQLLNPITSNTIRFCSFEVIR